MFEATLDMSSTIKKLKKLPDRVQKNVVTGAIRKISSEEAKEAKRLVPVRTGNLKQSIKVKAKKTKNKNEVRFWVGPTTVKKKKDIKKDGKVVWTIRGIVVDGWYGRLIELGTKNMEAKPFLRPAFDKVTKNGLTIAHEYMKKRLPKELKKL